MNITEIRVKLVGSNAERLKAFCSITLDGDFVIRDLKVIDGVGGLFVAMPSRKLSDRCPRCGSKNHLRARFCNDCGNRLDETRSDRQGQSRAKLHADVAHPINADCRERLQNAVIEAFNAELQRSQEPGYRPADYDDDDVSDDFTEVEVAPRRQRHAPVEADESSADSDDFESLIAGLKQEAAARRERRDRREPDERHEGQRPHRREERRAPAPASDREAHGRRPSDGSRSGRDETEKPERSDTTRPAARRQPAADPPHQPREAQPAAARIETVDQPGADEPDDDAFSEGIL